MAILWMAMPTNGAPPVLPDVIAGPRLDLVLVTVEQLFAREAASGPIDLGFTDPHDVLGPDNSPLRFRVAQVREDPSVNSWLIRIAVVRQTGAIVGLVNFHAPPDEHGMVEIGYRVHPLFRRQGFAREMATTMWRFVAELPTVRTLRATVAPDNTASIAIMEHAGFTHVGEQEDPEDGTELIYEISARDYLA
jgi:[ribosomal protein S5]-alanine N-acetyltransferase